MPIAITHVTESTFIVIGLLIAALLFSARRTERTDLFPVAVTQELKGLGILTVVFAHISYMLVTDNQFLYPLSIVSGVGVDLFLFMSGYGLTVGMLKRPLTAMEFYKRRLTRVFIPFWLVLIGLFCADLLFLGIHYPATYMLRSLLGWFPTAKGFEDVNSPLWYISWIVMFYALFPWVFKAQRLYISALLLAVIANALAMLNPLALQVNWLHSLHTYSFSLGMLLAWALQRAQTSQANGYMALQRLRTPLLATPRYIWIAVLLILIAVIAPRISPSDWPQLAQLLYALDLNAATVIGQASSLVMMLAFVLLFALKTVDSRFLAIIGAYSYEIYLLHWPLMARYDLFFAYLPAWLAVVAWLAVWLAMARVLQKLSSQIGAWVDRVW